MISCLTLADRVLALRLGAALLAVGACFLLDDPTEDTTIHLPTSLRMRRSIRLVLAAPGVLAAWVLLLLLSLRTADGTEGFPTVALTLELGAMVAVALTLTVLLARLVPEGFGSVAAGPVLLALCAATFALPTRWAVFVMDPADPRWWPAHRAWWSVLGGGLVGLWALSRDPWKPRLSGRLSSRRAAKRVATESGM